MTFRRGLIWLYATALAICLGMVVAVVWNMGTGSTLDSVSQLEIIMLLALLGVFAPLFHEATIGMITYAKDHIRIADDYHFSAKLGNLQIEYDLRQPWHLTDSQLQLGVSDEHGVTIPIDGFRHRGLTLREHLLQLELALPLKAAAQKAHSAS